MGENILKRIIDSLKGSKFASTKFGDFCVGVLTELDSVTWPSKDEVYNSTVVVLIVTAIFATYSGFWDVMMNFVRQLILPLYG
ncbi:MAG: preprotein translocase subunit SecE [Candidatus Hinthialibacter antarcticus]|nr:preprotein translocase subunit SecE [Candidatus Hinthialibacter antarcticus]